MTMQRDDASREPGDDCAAFETAVSDYLDDALTGDAADAAAGHLAGCDACQALVDDLRAIRAQAAALPPLQPSRDLWSGIDARIGASASSAQPRSAGDEDDAVPATPARQTALRRWFGPHYATRVAALAAGLVVATAGLTYLATRALIRTPLSSHVAASGRAVPRSGVELVSQPQTSEYLYDNQIASLHKILEQRRAQLDPKTVAVIEHNLGVIDTAIAQSKAALAKDPANAFLVDQLDRNLNTKLELLQTVALLPSRT
jgi:anti-sigma factor RsiW